MIVRALRRVRGTGAFGHGVPCPYCGNVKVKINGNCAGRRPAVREATAKASTESRGEEKEKEPAGRRRYGMAAVLFENAESVFVGGFRFS